MNYIDMINHANTETKFETLINGNINAENAVIAFKNFTGKPTDFNPAGGKRTFCLVLSKEYAEKLRNADWNVKVKEIRDKNVEGEKTMTVSYDTYMSQYQDTFDHALMYTEVVINENSEYPPNIYKISEFNGEKTMAAIPPEQWYRLDSASLMNMDIVLHPYVHKRNLANPDAKKGYLKTMYVTVVPVNDFGGKYAGYAITGE